MDRPVTGAPEASGDDGRPAPAAVSVRVTAAHRDVGQLLDASRLVTDTDLDDPRRGGRVFDALVAAASAHLSAMRTVLYPRIRRSLPDAREDVRRLERGAREMASVMRAMEQHLGGDVHRPGESMHELHADLDTLLGDHVRTEEELVRRLEAAWSDDERRHWASKIESSMRHAPTRPHPHLPRSPFLLTPAVGVTARWDHLLDTLDARAVAGRPVRQPGPPGMWGWYLLGRPSGTANDQPSDDRAARDDRAAPPRRPTP
jgi:hypothetical protein